MKEVLSVKEAAVIMAVTPAALREYLKQGVIPGKKVGKQWRILRSELMEALKPDNPAKGII